MSIDRLILIDRRIDAHEGAALKDRWEFGRAMLAARDGAGRLPNGYLSELAQRTGKSRRELGYRAQFAEAYPSEAELRNALRSYDSWRGLVKSLKTAPAVATAPVPLPPEGRYRTIVADPPWKFQNTATRGAAEGHYPTMTVEELCALTIVPDHAADEAHLFVWTTSVHLPEAFKVMASWGFDFKTYLVWVKPQMGLGNYFRVSTELVLFGTKGGMRTLDRTLLNYFTADRARHSAKPPAFHDLVMRASPGPYLELFARCAASPECTCSKCRLGWTTWGDQT